VVSPLPMPRDLPVLPAPRVRALLLMWNPDATLEHFVSVAQGDPALTAAVLRGANSASSAPIERVTRAQDAIVRLGFDRTKHIISAAVTRSQFDDIENSWIDAKEMWRHLVAVGLLAEAATETAEERVAAFTGGLLHDLGRLSLAATNPGRYSRTVEMVRAGIDVMDAERQMMGVTHTTWGERVARHWGLPEPIVAAVANHHGADAGGLAARLVEARRISWRLGIGDGVATPSLGELAADDDMPAPLRVLGGIDGLMERIRWYRQAFEG